MCWLRIKIRALLNTGTDWNRTEYTGVKRQNDAGMKRNGQEWYRNVLERAGMTREYTEMSLNETAINTNMVSST